MNPWGLPQVGKASVQVFVGNGTAGAAATANWQRCDIPVWASRVFILAIAPGGGGGRPINLGTVGGGGGGSGGMTRWLGPALALPGVLWVRPGRGGAGGAASNTAGSAGDTLVLGIFPNNIAANLIFSQAGGGGGAAATTAGAAGAIGTATSGAFASAGLWVSVAGRAGAAGAAAGGGTGGDVTPGSNGIITVGGSGGGNSNGVTGVGGALIGAGPWRAVAASGLPGDGRPTPKLALPYQLTRLEPFILYPGLGGSGSNGAGSSGDFGCGGGGGGGGSAVNSGNGGNGGDGLVVVMAW